MQNINLNKKCTYIITLCLIFLVFKLSAISVKEIKNLNYSIHNFNLKFIYKL